MVNACNPSTQSTEAGDCEFRANLSYTSSSRSVWIKHKPGSKERERENTNKRGINLDLSIIILM